MTPAAKGEANYTDASFLTAFGPFGFTDLDIDTSSRFTQLTHDMLRHPEQWIPPANPDSATGKEPE